MNRRNLRAAIFAALLWGIYMELQLTIKVPLSGAIGQQAAEEFAENVRQAVENNASAWLPDSALPAGEIIAGVIITEPE